MCVCCDLGFAFRIRILINSKVKVDGNFALETIFNHRMCFIVTLIMFSATLVPSPANNSATQILYALNT